MKSKLSVVFFLFLYAAALYSQDIKVLSSTSSSILIEYNAVLTDTSALSVGGQTYRRIQILNGFNESKLESGDPEIQVREILIGVPSETGNTIQVLSSEKYSITGKLVPLPEFKMKDNLFESSYSENDAYLINKNYELVEFGEYGLVRELGVQNIIIRPVMYDPNSGSIVIYKKILFSVNFSRPADNLVTLSDNYLSDVILNYGIARDWALTHKEQGLKKINSNSVLSNGTWYKIPVKDEGIYKIDRNKLSAFGIDPSTVDPRTIKIYGNGGYLLSENLGDAAVDDLVENSVYISGEEDGKFDEGDYILFYGRGTDFWEYDETDKIVSRHKHWYSKENYYFITSGGSAGKRMTIKNSLNEASFTELSSTKAYYFFEEDKINKEEGGRIYVGNEFSSTDRMETYITSLPRLIPGEINYRISFLNYSRNRLQLRIDENGANIFNSTLSGGTGPYAEGKLNTFSAVYSGTLPDNRSSLRFEFSPGSADFGHLDFFEITYDREMMADDDKLFIYAPDENNIFQYTLSNFSNSDIHVFDITDFSNVKKINPLQLSGGQFKFQSDEISGSPSKYLGLCSAKFLIPSDGVKIDNSDLHNTSPGAEYIIITHKNFKNEALDLKEYRTYESDYKFNTEVVDIEAVYNEFSGGIIDPTAIRNFLRYAFLNWQITPFYVLLFGDGTYDVLNVEGHGNNFIPTYQTVESFDYVFAYPTDDYFARINGNDLKVDLALSRLNVNTAEEAEIVIEKIKYYESSSDKGLWRNQVTLIADDGLTSTSYEGSLHVQQSETLSSTYIPDYIDRNKIYLSSYPTVNTTFGRRKPLVNQAIINSVNAGTLILNFIGHGNPDVWAHEQVFDRKVSIAQFKNKDFFFLTAATCDFGKYDDPVLASGTEEMLMLDGRGMIGGVSAARPVISNDNAALNNLFYKNLFEARDAQNLPSTIGNAYFKMKQQRTNQNDEKFHLFCEPVLRLNQPRLKANVDSINGLNLSADVQIKALSSVSIDATVLNPDGSANNQFDGEAIISVFDSERSVDLSDINYSMTVQGGLIFRGRTTIENGMIKVDFTVPKDISYENKNGKIIAYFLNDQTDGIGFTNKILVGGSDTSAVNDNKGPDLEILFDDLNAENSYLVNPDFTLFVKISDETGLNTTGTGIGHKLEGVLNNDEENPLDFTDYFIGDLDAGGKSGVVEYKFVNMDPGDYSINVKAWDVFNNAGSDQTSFTVVSENEVTVRDVYNYPNPFSDNTVFTFQHNLNGLLNVKIKIYTVAGRMIKDIEEKNISDKFVKIYWDGRDNDGSPIANGTYLYKINIQTSDGQYTQNVLGKLAVIR